MRDAMKYINSKGDVINFGMSPYYINENEIRNFEWSYTTYGYKIKSFNRGIATKKLPIFVYDTENAATSMNHLNDVFDFDVQQGVRGKLYIGDYYLLCNFIASEKSDYTQTDGHLKNDYTVVTDEHMWVSEKTTSFRPGTTPPDTNSVSGTLLNILDAINSTMFLTSWTKNLLTAMTLANLRTANTSGTWTDTNSTVSTYVVSGITVTVTHSSGNVLSINANGTASSLVYFRTAKSVSFPIGDYTISGCPSGGTASTYSYFVEKDGTSNQYYDIGSGAQIPITSSSDAWTFYIKISSGVTVTNKLFLPQIESGSTKHNFVPPSGYPVYACQKNILPQSFSVLVSSNPSGTWTTVSSTVSTYLINGMTLTITHDGDKITAWSINGTSSGVSYIYYNANFALNTGTYTCSDGNTKLSMFGLKSDGTTLSLCGTAVTSASFTLSSNTVFKSWYFYIIGSVTFTNEAITPQLEVGSTATTWEAYNGNTYNLTNDTASPVPMTCYANMTNVFSWYGGFLNLTYPREIPVYLDYPYDFAFDYMSLEQNQSLTNPEYFASHFQLIAYGACTNPSIIIGGHKYEVDCELGVGEYLVINSRTKKVYKVETDGTIVNQFNLRNRDSYIFEKMPSGSNAVLWNGLFGFDVTLLEERSEPKWG